MACSTHANRNRRPVQLLDPGRIPGRLGDIGGGFFGRIGDRIGRSRTLSLTILTYALFTGLAFFCEETWWQLLVVRFLAALGIGGEWAVGASLLAETWPRRWRPWIAAVLQSGVNVGILPASCTTFLLAGRSPRVVFLVGVLPALLVFWIREEVPETDEWRSARAGEDALPGIAELSGARSAARPSVTILVCSVSLDRRTRLSCSGTCTS